MREIARVEVETHGSVPVARIDGEIDMSNAGAIGDRLRGLLSNRSEALVVDLGPTTYLDSSGITLLFGLVEELRRRQQELHVVVPDESPLRRVIGIVGLDKAVPMHATLEAALAGAG
jgi:anti-anti-sigma factor